MTHEQPLSNIRVYIRVYLPFANLWYQWQSGWCEVWSAHRGWWGPGWKGFWSECPRRSPTAGYRRSTCRRLLRDDLRPLSHTHTQWHFIRPLYSYTPSLPHKHTCSKHSHTSLINATTVQLTRGGNEWVTKQATSKLITPHTHPHTHTLTHCHSLAHTHTYHRTDKSQKWTQIQ